MLLVIKISFRSTYFRIGNNLVFVTIIGLGTQAGKISITCLYILELQEITLVLPLEDMSDVLDT